MMVEGREARLAGEGSRDWNRDRTQGVHTGGRWENEVGGDEVGTKRNSSRWVVAGIVVGYTSEGPGGDGTAGRGGWQDQVAAQMQSDNATALVGTAIAADDAPEDDRQYRLTVPNILRYWYNRMPMSMSWSPGAVDDKKDSGAWVAKRLRREQLGGDAVLRSQTRKSNQIKSNQRRRGFPSRLIMYVHVHCAAPSTSMQVGQAAQITNSG